MVLPDPAPLPPRPDRRTPVLLVAGLPGRASAAVDRAAAALAHAEGTVVVRHHLEDLREGVVRRTLRTVLATTETVLELAHGCVSCTLRADLLPLLCTLAARESVHRIVLELDPGGRPGGRACGPRRPHRGGAHLRRRRVLARRRDR
ncbi:Probable cobalamin synthesis protein [Mycobacteroides abscessus subsp. abscessus]|nr:Probable cobalamin synthesis protein [Mycobacteroides abscessus subsp. abscessus]